jgi:ArsR family transcriptional regulator, arsenate/arsenite/antimonite-responsive transcriptional repressor
MDDSILIFKALGDETRFRIIHLLLTHDLCVGALADRLSLSTAAVSQHLQILRKAGLVRGEKRGYWTHYGVDRDVLRRVGETLKETADRAPDVKVACHGSIRDDVVAGVLGNAQFPIIGNFSQDPVSSRDDSGNRAPEQIQPCQGNETDSLHLAKSDQK